MAVVSAPPPPLSHTFHVEAPFETPVDSLIDAVASVVYLPEVDQLHHLVGLRFNVVIRSRAVVSRILEAGLCALVTR